MKITIFRLLLFIVLKPLRSFLMFVLAICAWTLSFTFNLILASLKSSKNTGFKYGVTLNLVSGLLPLFDSKVLLGEFKERFWKTDVASAVWSTKAVDFSSPVKPYTSQSRWNVTGGKYLHYFLQFLLVWAAVVRYHRLSVLDNKQF